MPELGPQSEPVFAEMPLRSQGGEAKIVPSPLIPIGFAISVYVIAVLLGAFIGLVVPHLRKKIFFGLLIVGGILLAISG